MQSNLYHSWLLNSEGKDAKHQSLGSALEFACCISRALFWNITAPCWLSGEGHMHASWLGPLQDGSQVQGSRCVSPKSEYWTQHGSEWMSPVWHQHFIATILHYLQPEISFLPWQQTAFSTRDLPRTVVPC